MIVKICMIVDVERPRCSGGEVRMIEERELRGSQDTNLAMKRRVMYVATYELLQPMHVFSLLPSCHAI